MSYQTQIGRIAVRPYETWVEDEVHPLTIKYSGIAKAVLASMVVENVTKGIRSIWDRNTGIFDPPLQAGTDDQLRFEFIVENQGEYGVVYLVLWDQILNRALGSSFSNQIPPGAQWPYNIDTDADTGGPILMPPRDMSLTVSLGHIVS